MQRASLLRLLVPAAVIVAALVGHSSCIIDECEDGICVPETSTNGGGGSAGAGGSAAAGGEGGATGGGGGS